MENISQSIKLLLEPLLESNLHNREIVYDNIHTMEKNVAEFMHNLFKKSMRINFILNGNFEHTGNSINLPYGEFNDISPCWIERVPDVCLYGEMYAYFHSIANLLK